MWHHYCCMQHIFFFYISHRKIFYYQKRASFSSVYSLETYSIIYFFSFVNKFYLKKEKRTRSFFRRDTISASLKGKHSAACTPEEEYQDSFRPIWRVSNEPPHEFDDRVVNHSRCSTVTPRNVRSTIKVWQNRDHDPRSGMSTTSGSSVKRGK